MQPSRPTNAEAPSLRQTLIDLGSRSEIVRKAARERAISAGAAELLGAIMEEEPYRQKRHRRWRWSFLLCPLVFAAPATILNSPAGVALGFLLVMVGSVALELHGSARRWQQEAATLLTHFDDPAATIG